MTGFGSLIRGLGVRMLWGSVGVTSLWLLRGLLGEAPEAEPGAGLEASIWKSVAGRGAWGLLQCEMGGYVA